MNVLLIDDDDICNLISSKTLQRMGFADEIHVAMNGEQGISLLEDHFQNSTAMPDVILLDLEMPVMNGFEFLEAFRKLPIPNKESIKIIIVTSSSDPNDMRKAKTMGISHYLTKPISEEKLMTILQEHSLAA
jgi:CheY-like chemotaxis protein